VAEEIRVLLARKRISAAELARRTGIKQSTMSRRMTGETAFDMDDLELIADALDVEVTDLMPKQVRAGGDPKLGSGQIGRTADLASRSHVAPRPFSQARKDSVRPVSAVPASRRRPTTVRSAGRPT
jgi:DNA-binding Xre family transcriptional regulator